MSVQSCLTLCSTVDCRPPGCSVHGIFQARILEGVAMPSSRGSSRPRAGTCVSCIAGGHSLYCWAPEKPFMSALYCFYYCSIVIAFEIRDCGVSSSVVLSQLCLGSLGMGPMNFRVFHEKGHGICFLSAPSFSSLVKKNGIIRYGTWQKSKKTSHLSIFVTILGSF